MSGTTKLECPVCRGTMKKVKTKDGYELYSVIMAKPESKPDTWMPIQTVVYMCEKCFFMRMFGEAFPQQ